MKLIAFLIVTPLYAAWILLCSALAFFGLLLKSKSTELEPEDIKKRKTICRVLNNKKLLTDSEYAFETEQVAPTYQETTFQGYVIILGPMIRLLEVSHYFDNFMLMLVKKWMNVHQQLLGGKKKTAWWEVPLTRLCVGIAQSLGCLVLLFKKLSQDSI